ncbi:MAG: hypothetical protein Q9184_005887 [Pyrenodesmia sp. 2 TL-2023]
MTPIPIKGQTGTSRAASSSSTSNSTPSGPVKGTRAHGNARGGNGYSGKAFSASSGSGGGSHRSIGETFKVNPANGTMSLSLPVDVIPGRSDFGPALSLSYDSGSGNGPVGIGWALPTHSITRKTSKQVPMYDESDTFVLSGTEDLVPVLAGGQRVISGYSVQKYRPRIENNFFRIEQWVNGQDANDVYWRSISPENVITVFGRTDESRIFDTDVAGRKRIFTWLVSESFDGRGNTMRYMYKSEDSDGLQDGQDVAMCELGRTSVSRGRMKYLKSIKYGNRSPGRAIDSWVLLPIDSMDYMFEVILDYGEHDASFPTPKETRPWSLRKDSFSTYKSGFELRTYRLVRRILMFHHLPEKLGLQDCLVRSVLLTYAESATGSFLQSTRQCGHNLDQTDAYSVQTLAPHTFEYSTPCSVKNIPWQKIEGSNLENLSHVGGPRSEWIDLEGEGSPGLLVFREGAWSYQRNELLLDPNSSESFGPTQILSGHPNMAQGGDFYFEDLDRNGNLDLVCLDADGRLDGFQERSKQGWTGRNKFESIPNVKVLQSPAVRRLDLTGNGLQDILRPQDESNAIVWQQCLGKGGFSEERRVHFQGALPILQSGDEKISIHLADMSGDGLSDIVHVSNGLVVYWPNLGHGNFGSKIAMDNPPRFDRDDQFTHARVRLADIDGSGTTDILYVTPGGHAKVYYNQAGNSWSSGSKIANFPQVDNLSSVFAMDLRGSGTSCLCWTGPAADRSANSLFFLDLMNDQKPHLLTKYSNGLGLSTTVSYRPSTWFYLNDLREGNSWKTKLSFPVHCVEKICHTDETAMNVMTTRYAYHDGFYDAFEGDFNGFGMVENWDAEVFNADGGNPFIRPPVLTKTWYHTGAGEIATSPSSACSPSELHHSKLPSDLSTIEAPEVCRALKGKRLRTELFSDDGSAKAHLPYEVTEDRYTVVRIEAPNYTLHLPGIYNVHPRETLTTHYERDLGDPRCEHLLTLQVNEYGDVMKSANIVYGKRASGLPDAEDQAKQQESVFTYTETEYTNAVEDIDSYRKPVSSSEKQYRVLGYPLDDLADYESMSISGCSQLVSATAVDPALDQAPRDFLTKILLKEIRAEYLDNMLARRLPRGALEAFSILDQTFTLTMTPSILTKVYGDLADIANQDVSELMRIGGYVDLDSDGCWWSPSEKSSHSLDSANELQAARTMFYMPTIWTDQFGNMSFTTYDDLQLLPLQTVDPMGYTESYSNNYIHLYPSETTDLNANRVQTRFDTLGFPVGIAHLGKVDEGVGDSLDGFKDILSSDDLKAFIEDPVHTAKGLLGNAGLRNIYSAERISLVDSTRNIHIPPFHASISRDKHFREEDVKVLIQITYQDGRGEDLQTVTLVDQKETALQWRISEWEIRDNKGQAVRRYQPSFAPSHLFVPQANRDSPVTTMFLDPLERVIGILHADYGWEKTEFGSWSQAFFDAGDTVLSDPLTDSVLGPNFRALESAGNGFLRLMWHGLRVNDQAGRFSKWDIEAAKRSAIYHNTPTMTHYDALNRPILTIDDYGSSNTIHRSTYNLRGDKVMDMDTETNRIVEKTCFDLLGRSVHRASMESGEHWSLLDCKDQEMLAWNSRRVRSRFVYDKLRRQTEVWRARKSNEALTNKTYYGNVNVGSEMVRNNLLGEVTHVYDQSGLQRNTGFDFKGNCCSNFRQFAEDYKSLLDWSTDRIALQSVRHFASTKYDALNRATESIDPQGNTTRRKFNLSEALEAVSWRDSLSAEWQPYVSSITYEPDEKPRRIDYGNGTHTVFTYDKMTRNVVNTKIWAGFTILKDISLTYDCVGRITHAEDSVQKNVYFDNCVVDASNDYTYDSTGQLIQAEGREQFDSSNGGGQSFVPYKFTAPFGQKLHPGDGNSMCRYVESYTYTNTGNIKSMKHEAGDGATVSGWTRDYFYEEDSLLDDQKSNRLSRTEVGGKSCYYRYDQNSAGKQGCMTSMPGYSKLTWDCEDKLRSSSTQINNKGVAETTWYVYDSAGQRVRKVTDRATTDRTSAPSKMKETLYLPGFEIFRTFRGDGSSMETESKTSHVLGTSRIALIENGLVRYQADQGLELDDHGNIISYEEYSPFGATTYVACGRKITAPSKYRYASYERDFETGLYHCGERYYAPWLGRWISPDPIGTSDGLNLYRYVSNDPVNMDDPGGTCEKARGSHGRQGKLPIYSKIPKKNSDGEWRLPVLGWRLQPETKVSEDDSKTKVSEKRSETPNLARKFKPTEEQATKSKRQASSNTRSTCDAQQSVSFGQRGILKDSKIETDKRVILPSIFEKDRARIEDPNAFFGVSKVGYVKKDAQRIEQQNAGVPKQDTQETKKEKEPDALVAAKGLVIDIGKNVRRGNRGSTARKVVKAFKVAVEVVEGMKDVHDVGETFGCWQSIFGS